MNWHRSTKKFGVLPARAPPVGGRGVHGLPTRSTIARSCCVCTCATGGDPSGHGQSTLVVRSWLPISVATSARPAAS